MADNMDPSSTNSRDDNMVMAVGSPKMTPEEFEEFQKRKQREFDEAIKKSLQKKEFFQSPKVEDSVNVTNNYKETVNQNIRPNTNNNQTTSHAQEQIEKEQVHLQEEMLRNQQKMVQNINAETHNFEREMDHNTQEIDHRLQEQERQELDNEKEQKSFMKRTYEQLKKKKFSSNKKSFKKGFSLSSGEPKGSLLFFFLFCTASNLLDLRLGFGTTIPTILVDVLTYIAIFMFIYPSIDRRSLAIPLLLEIFFPFISSFMISHYGSFVFVFTKWPFWFFYSLYYIFSNWNNESLINDKQKKIILLLVIIIALFFTFPYLKTIEFSNIYADDMQHSVYKDIFSGIGNQGKDSVNTISWQIKKGICEFKDFWAGLTNLAPPECMEIYNPSNEVDLQQVERKKIPTLLDSRFDLSIEKPDITVLGKEVSFSISAMNLLDHEVIVNLQCGVYKDETGDYTDGNISELADTSITIPAHVRSFNKIYTCVFDNDNSPDFSGTANFYVDALIHNLESVTIRTLLFTSQKNIESQLASYKERYKKSALIDDVFYDLIKNYDLSDQATNDYLLLDSKIAEEVVSDESASAVIGLDAETTLPFKIGLTNNYKSASNNKGSLLSVNSIDITLPSILEFDKLSCGYDSSYLGRKPIEFIKPGFENQYFLDQCTLRPFSESVEQLYSINPSQLIITAQYDYKIHMETEVKVDDLPGYYMGKELKSPISGLTRQQISPSYFPQFKFNKLRGSYLTIPVMEGAAFKAVADGYVMKSRYSIYQGGVPLYNYICIEHTNNVESHKSHVISKYLFFGKSNIFQDGKIDEKVHIKQGEELGTAMSLNNLSEYDIKLTPLYNSEFNSLVRFQLGYGKCDENVAWVDPAPKLLALIDGVDNE